MSFQNIPAELRQLLQWVCWRYEDRGGEKPTKVPYNPRNNYQASVTDVTTWSNFSDCVDAVGKGRYDGIGFVFTDNDPYIFVDLDDTKGDAALLERQRQIFSDLDSYSEVSPSGKGAHVICKGKIPSGRKRNAIEIYSNGRYATFTGNVILPAKGIEDRNDLCNALYERMGAGVAVYQFDGSSEEKETDTAIIEKASRAANGDKFKKLLTGDWSDYPSQSEADFAFVDIIAFYTQSSVQITRIFRSCPLGQRLKANRDSYIQYMLNKCFDRMLPQIDFDGLRNAVEAKIAEQRRDAEQIEMFQTTQRKAKQLPGMDIVPPGLVGELARFIFSQSPRPVAEIALAGAMGFLAGIAGRAYNVSGDGLNQYIMVISPTGTGKEAMARGINRIINSIRAQVPTAAEFVGPGEIRSDAALLRTLARTPCFCSVIGEFGQFMEQISDPRATSSLKGIKKLLRDLYHKSGANQSHAATVYSDKDKNIEPIYSPNLTILGEGNPDEFYASLDESMVSGGLLPRFLLIEYHGSVPPLNKGFEAVAPSFALLEQVAALCAYCQTQMHGKKVTNILRNTEAEAHFDQFEKFATYQINNSNKDVFRQLWNRAHIKAMKIAGLVAVGINPYDPVITIDCAQWATNIVSGDIRNIVRRFEVGDIGGDNEESKQVAEVCRTMHKYLTGTLKELASYGVTGQMHNEKIIPWLFLQRKLGAAAAFRNDRAGATNALKRTIQTLIDNGDIREIGKGELGSKFGFSGRAFMVANIDILEA